MREYFCTEFCSLVQQTTVQVRCIYLMHTNLLKMLISETNFAIVQMVQKADFIIKVIECPMPTLL